MSEYTPIHDIEKPEEGSKPWTEAYHTFADRFDTRVERRGTEGFKDEVPPIAGAKFVATDTGRVFYGNGDEWVRDDTTGPDQSLTSLEIENDATNANHPVRFDQFQEHVNNQQNPHAIDVVDIGGVHESGGTFTGNVTVEGGVYPILDDDTFTESDIPSNYPGGYTIFRDTADTGFPAGINSIVETVNARGPNNFVQRNWSNGSDIIYTRVSNNSDSWSDWQVQITEIGGTTAIPGNLSVTGQTTFDSFIDLNTNDVRNVGAIDAQNVDAPLEGLRRDEFALNTRTFNIDAGGNGGWWRIARVDNGGTTNDSRVNITIDGTGPYGSTDHRLDYAYFNARNDAGTLNYAVKGDPTREQRSAMVFTRDPDTGVRYFYIRANGFLAANLTIQHTSRFGEFDFAQLNSDASVIPTEVQNKITHDSDNIEPGMSEEMGGLHLHDDLQVDNNATISGNLDANGIIQQSNDPVATQPWVQNNTLASSGGTVDGDVTVNGTLSSTQADVGGNEVWHDGNRTQMHEVVTTATDTTVGPLDININIPDPTAYATYEIRGIIQGQHASGDGAEVDMEITLDNNTDPIYDYTLMDRGTVSHTLENNAWIEKLWRRYKTPVHYTIAADSIPDDGVDAETAFITINSHAHSSRRGLMHGRTGNTTVNGGHPSATVGSIQMSTVSDFTADLVVYGVDWRSVL